MSVIRFDEGKFWFKKETTKDAKHVLTIGVSVEALEEFVGEVERLLLPDPEDDYSKQEYVCELSGSEGKLKIFTPVSGLITEVNDEVLANKEIMSEDPENEGWLIRIEYEDESELMEYL